MEDYLPLIIQLVSGAVGGNIAGALMKEKSLGTLWNSVAGILGGGIGGSLLGLIGLDGDGILGSIAGGGIGGGVLMLVIGLIKNAMNKS